MYISKPDVAKRQPLGNLLEAIAMAAIFNFGIFKKILEMAEFWSETRVTPLNICIWGQGIHFWGYFLDLTKFTRNGVKNTLLFGQKGQNLESLKIWSKIL